METDWEHEVPGDLGAGRKHPMLMHFPSYPGLKSWKRPGTTCSPVSISNNAEKTPISLILN